MFCKVSKSRVKTTNTASKNIGKKKILKIPKDLKKTPTKKTRAPKKKRSSKKDENKKQEQARPKKTSNVVYKEATGLTSDEDSDFSSESEGEWDERKKDSQGNERTGKRQSLIERYRILTEKIKAADVFKRE